MDSRCLSSWIVGIANFKCPFTGIFRGRKMPAQFVLFTIDNALYLFYTLRPRSVERPSAKLTGLHTPSTYAHDLAETARPPAAMGTRHQASSTLLEL